MSNFLYFFFFFPSSFFEITMLVLKILRVILPTWWWQIHGKITFFWNFYLMNYWTYTLTDLQNLHGMIAQDCFEDAGTAHTTTFPPKKKSIETFLFACCILWFSDQLICCLVFPADLGYIVTELLLYAFICRVYVYVVVVVIAPYSLICENSSHFNTTPRGVRWGPAAKFRQPSLAEIYIIHTAQCSCVHTGLIWVGTYKM